LNLLIGVDVSDSTNRPELREAFAAELARIAGSSETSLTVLYSNSRIQRIDCFRSRNINIASYDGGGFTDLRPVFAYARTMKPLPAAVIYLTDGIGPAPETMELPTLWVLTQEGELPVPWGVELRLDL
jgi:predicted metal-dependent peptidase